MAVTKNQVIAAIAHLKSLDQKTTDFAEIKLHTDVLVRAGFLGAYFPEYHQPIYRGRPVKPDKIWHNVSEISYSPKTDGTKLRLNRLSTNNLQIFYGALMPQEARLDQITAMIEVGSIMQDESDEDEEYVQIGKWTVKKGFDIAIVGLHSNLAGKNANAQALKNIHSDLTGSLNEQGEVIEMVAEFMSHEFSKKVSKDNEWEYKISAAYGEGIFESGIKAIQFPSVKAAGLCFNIALHKDLVDQALDIEVAAVTRLRRIVKEIFVDWYLQSPTIVSGKFKWEEPPSTAVTGEYQMKMIRENMLRNDGKFINPNG